MPRKAMRGGFDATPVNEPDGRVRYASYDAAWAALYTMEGAYHIVPFGETEYILEPQIGVAYPAQSEAAPGDRSSPEAEMLFEWSPSGFTDRQIEDVANSFHVPVVKLPNGRSAAKVDLAMLQTLTSTAPKPKEKPAEAESKPEPAPPPGEAALPEEQPATVPYVLIKDKPQSAEALVADYVRYSIDRSPRTPYLFHQSAALWIVGLAIARRLKLAMDFDDVYPNLFALWIAPTTLFFKSTALKTVRKTVAKLFPYLLSAEETTPEAFLSDWSGAGAVNEAVLSPQIQEIIGKQKQYVAQRGIILEELSGFMAASGRDYNAGLTEYFIRLFDCIDQWERITRGQGKVIVCNTYLSVLAASTPSLMRPYMEPERQWGSGWWPRWAILAPDVERLPWAKPRRSAQPVAYMNAVKGLHERLGDECLSIDIDPGALDEWERYSERMLDHEQTNSLDPRLAGTYGRMPTNALKIASHLAALQWPQGQSVPCITPDLVHSGIEIAETWRASAKRVLRYIRAASIDTSQKEIRALKVIAHRHPKGATLDELRKAMSNVPKDEVLNIALALESKGETKRAKRNPTKKGGRPTWAWVMVTE